MIEDKSMVIGGYETIKHQKDDANKIIEETNHKTLTAKTATICCSFGSQYFDFCRSFEGVLVKS